MSKYKLGYARVSTLDQDPALQHDALTAAGCDRIFIDKASGKLESRSALNDHRCLPERGQIRADHHSAVLIRGSAGMVPRSRNGSGRRAPGPSARARASAGPGR